MEEGGKKGTAQQRCSTLEEDSPASPGLPRPNLAGPASGPNATHRVRRRILEAKKEDEDVKNAGLLLVTVFSPSFSRHENDAIIIRNSATAVPAFCALHLSPEALYYTPSRTPFREPESLQHLSLCFFLPPLCERLRYVFLKFMQNAQSFRSFDFKLSGEGEKRRRNGWLKGPHCATGLGMSFVACHFVTIFRATFPKVWWGLGGWLRSLTRRGCWQCRTERHSCRLLSD